MDAKKQIPDHEGFFGRPAHARSADHRSSRTRLLAATVLLVSILGCGDKGSKQTAGAPVHPASLPVAEPRFITGGAPGNVAIACGETIRRVDVAGTRLTSEALPAQDYMAVYFDPAGGASRSIVRSDRGPVLLEGGQVTELPGWPEGATAAAAAFSPDGRFVAAAPAPNGGLLVWKLPLQPVLTVPPDEISVVSLLTWSADGRSVLVTDSNNRISIFRPPKKKAVFTQDVDPGAEGRISAVDLSPDGDWYVMAANAIVIRAWQLPFLNAQLKAWGRVEKLFFAGDVGEVVTIDETNTAIHWLVNYGKVRADTSRVLENVAALGVPSGGNSFFSLGRDGRVRAFRSGDLAPLGEVPDVACPVSEALKDSAGE